MAKKKAAESGSKLTAKAAKAAKMAKNTERKAKKKAGKSKETRTADDDDQDLEAILEKMQRDWEDQHKVTEELVEGPPSRRANATLTPCPNGNHLWCIGGEFFSDDKKAYFYNDVFRYSPDKDEWRKFVSPTCPGPRSAHAVAPSPAGGGKLFLFGGEFSSLHQTTFHHYRDFWCFDITTHTWDRIETKVLPSARSGHRMAMWKHYVVLFGGFYDPGIRTNYLSDLWLFDTQEYKWKQAEFKPNERQPSPRSGFSFLPTPDGVLLHGGYCKEYHKGKRPVGVMLEDTWFLQVSLPTEADLKSKSPSSFNMPLLKWDQRKRSSTTYAPSIRSGCTMALWHAKSMGVLFGGVTDEDNHEETLDSVFHNDLYGYQLSANGRWLSMALKQPKQQGQGRKKKKKQATDHNSDEVNPTSSSSFTEPNITISHALDGVNPDDPNLTIPLPRYNAMLAVLHNKLYIYGGIYEMGTREYTLDDFHSIQLDRLDRYICLKKSDVVIPTEAAESSSGEDDEDGSDDSDSDHDDDEDDNPATKPPSTPPTKGFEDDKSDEGVALEVIAENVTYDESIRFQAAAFMGVSKDTTRSQEDVISTPLPGETLAMFYTRSREYWAQKAHESSDNTGKQLRRDGFAHAQERYKLYKPILKEVEKILAEAGLDEEEMRRSAAAGPSVRADTNRNRR